ncbi:MAG: hypothetical protein M0Z46_23140 [Actinomycetota bacterium]|nr:hypothetical protein [Actinomycetota bacterium]
MRVNDSWRSRTQGTSSDQKVRRAALGVPSEQPASALNGTVLIRHVVLVLYGDTWRNIRSGLDRIHLVTMTTSKGTVSKRSELTPGQRHIRGRLELP